MGIFTYLLAADAVDEMKRHNQAMEEQIRRAALSPAERAAEDAARAEEEAEEKARQWRDCKIIALGLALGGVLFLIVAIAHGLGAF